MFEEIDLILYNILLYKDIRIRNIYVISILFVLTDCHFVIILYDWYLVVRDTKINFVLF